MGHAELTGLFRPSVWQRERTQCSQNLTFEWTKKLIVVFVILPHVFKLLEIFSNATPLRLYS